MISLTPEKLMQVKKIINTHLPGVEVWVFGSRSTQINLKPFSDLDLVIHNQKPISMALLAKLRESFSESNLPFRVDLLAWSELSEEFQKIIVQQKQLL